MSDLIERQAAMSLAGDLQIHSGEYQQYNQAINNYCAELIKLPSVQASYTDVEIKKMQDLESAQIEKAYQLGYEEGKKDAQPVDKDIDVPSADTISRQQAIDAIRKIYDSVGILGEKWAVDKCQMAIKDLPSAQPETSILTVTVAPDSDEIERVVRKIKDEPIVVLPSAQSERKKGKWIHGREIARQYLSNELVNIEYENYHCSECGYTVENIRWNVDGELIDRYCSVCGVEMEGEQDV